MVKCLSSIIESLYIAIKCTFSRNSNYAGLVAHGISDWYGMDTYTRLKNILTIGFEGERAIDNPNSIKYPTSTDMFSYSKPSKMKNTYGDSYAIIFDPPKNSRLDLNNELLSVGFSPVHSIREIHVKIDQNCNSDERKRFYEKNLPNIENVVLVFH